MPAVAFIPESITWQWQVFWLSPALLTSSHNWRDVQWHVISCLNGDYSCGHSSGIAPDSLFIIQNEPISRQKYELLSGHASYNGIKLSSFINILRCIMVSTISSHLAEKLTINRYWSALQQSGVYSDASYPYSERKQFHYLQQRNGCLGYLN